MRLIFCFLVVVLFVLNTEYSWARKHDKEVAIFDASEDRKGMINYFNEDIEAVAQSKDRDSRPDNDNDSGRPIKRPPKRPVKRPNKKKPNKKKKKPARRPRPRPSRRKTERSSEYRE